jgi:hypothetical protein
VQLGEDRQPQVVVTGQSRQIVDKHDLELASRGGRKQSR